MRGNFTHSRLPEDGSNGNVRSSVAQTFTLLESQHKRGTERGEVGWKRTNKFHLNFCLPCGLLFNFWLPKKIEMEPATRERRTKKVSNNSLLLFMVMTIHISQILRE